VVYVEFKWSFCDLLWTKHEINTHHPSFTEYRIVGSLDLKNGYSEPLLTTNVDEEMSSADTVAVKQMDEMIIEL